MVTGAINNVEAPTDEPMDTPIKRKAILEMAVAEVEAFVQSLQTNRAQITTFTQRSRSINSNNTFEKLHGRCATLLSRMETRALKLDASLEKLVEDAQKVRLMLLEMGDIVDPPTISKLPPVGQHVVEAVEGEHEDAELDTVSEDD